MKKSFLFLLAAPALLLCGSLAGACPSPAFAFGHVGVYQQHGFHQPHFQGRPFVVRSFGAYGTCPAPVAPAPVAEAPSIPLQPQAMPYASDPCPQQTLAPSFAPGYAAPLAFSPFAAGGYGVGGYGLGFNSLAVGGYAASPLFFNRLGFNRFAFRGHVGGVRRLGGIGRVGALGVGPRVNVRLGARGRIGGRGVVRVRIR